jgi:transposase
MPKRKRRSYTREQKADAVRMVREVGNLSQVARDLELTQSSLRNWVKQADIDEGKGPEGALTTEERAELRRLRRENRRLQSERDFLKRLRPSSPGKRISVRADRGGEGEPPGVLDVSSIRCFAQRLLRVTASASANCAGVA